MRDSEALALLQAAVPAADGETWADLGAGDGTFTRALATLVGPGGRVYAVDTDAAGLETIRRWADRAGMGGVVATLRGDVSRALDLPQLDGAVLANVLHFVRDARAALAGVASQLEPDGRLVLIEYEGRRPSRWVPYPVSVARFRELAAEAGFSEPNVVATRPSAYGGELYVATAIRRFPQGS
jgi:ubiquinone/menaquinone biosynthesis C-methylase UbiE